MRLPSTNHPHIVRTARPMRCKMSSTHSRCVTKSDASSCRCRAAASSKARRLARSTSAESGDLFGNGEMGFMGAAVGIGNAVGEFLDGEEAVGVEDAALAV